MGSTDPDSIHRDVSSAIKFFESRKRECEEQLERAKTIPGFRLVQITREAGETDITALEIQRLQQAIEHYQRAIDYLRGK